MAEHGHKWRKTGKANIEKLPDTSGNIIKYTGIPDCNWEVMKRSTDEPTLQPGIVVTCAGKTGTCVDAASELKPDTRLDGVMIWETTMTLALDTETV